MALVYCNVTTDLTNACPKLEQFQRKEIVKDWTLTASQSNTYQHENTGQVNMVFDDGVMLVVKTSIAEVEATAATFWYDTDNDILYVHPTSGEDPAGSLIEIGEDWDSFKDNMRDKAMQFMDSILAKIYHVPLAPRSIKTHDTAEYEYVITWACALLTSSFIVSRVDQSEGDKLRKMAWNPDREADEPKGLLNQLRDSDIVLLDQAYPNKIQVKPYASNTVNTQPLIIGRYTGSMFQIWRVMIDTGGARGTATYKVSFDGSGATYDLTLQETYDSSEDEYRMYVTEGIYLYWPVETYVQNEYWDIHLSPATDEITTSKIGTIELCR